MSTTEPTRRSLDWGCLSFVLLSIGAIALAYVVLQGIAGETGATGATEPARRVPAETTSPDEVAPRDPSRPRLTRRERIRLERELDEARRDLDDVRRQARLDLQPESRAAWLRAIAEAEQKVRDLEHRLGR